MTTILHRVQKLFETLDQVDDSNNIKERYDVSLNSVESQLEIILQHVMSVKSLGGVSSEDLLKLHNICREHMEKPQILEVAPASSERLDHWRLHGSDNKVWHSAIVAGRICICIQTNIAKNGSQTEEMLQLILECLQATIEKAIIPKLISDKMLANSKRTNHHRLALDAQVSQCIAVSRQLSVLLNDTKLSHSATHSIKSTAVSVLFALRILFPKDSKKKLAQLTEVAGDMLVQIFLHYSEHRTDILDEILGQSVSAVAGQNNMSIQGRNIHFLPSLLMRLIQSMVGLPDCGVSIDIQPLKSNRDLSSAIRYKTAADRLADLITYRLESIHKYSTYVVKSLVDHAFFNSTKEKHHQDSLLLLCRHMGESLTSTEWPIAWTLLATIFDQVVEIVLSRASKTATHILGLEVIASVGTTVQRIMSLKAESPTPSERISPYGEEDFLELTRCRSEEDTHMKYAVGYVILHWAEASKDWYANIEDKDYGQDAEMGFQDALRLISVIEKESWMDMHHDFEGLIPSIRWDVSHRPLGVGRLLEAPRRSLDMLMILARSRDAQVRRKAMNVMLRFLIENPLVWQEKPKIRLVCEGLLKDPSPIVRDAALSLFIGLFDVLPTTQEEILAIVLRCTSDETVMIRKHSIKALKEIYLMHGVDLKTRTSIAVALLRRTFDTDEGVQKLVVETFEEWWMSPYYRKETTSDTSNRVPHERQDFITIATLICKDKTQGFSDLIRVLRRIANSGRNSVKNLEVCKGIVGDLLVMAVNEPPSQHAEHTSLLRVLLVFAKGNPLAFGKETAHLLIPQYTYLESNMIEYICRVRIVRYVLPQLRIDNTVLEDMRRQMMRCLTRFPRRLLDEIFLCLWAISKTLQDDTILYRFATSCARNISSLNANDTNTVDSHVAQLKISKLLILSGMCAKHWEFDERETRDQLAVPTSKATCSISIEELLSFTSSNTPIGVRLAAFDAIGLVCQTKPQILLRVDEAFRETFNEHNPVLDRALLEIFKEFYSAEAKGSTSANSSLRAEETSVPTHQSDMVGSFLAQKFMDEKGPITSLAMAGQDINGQLAAEVICAVDVQGLLRPGVCVPVWIALQTSQNASIARMSLERYRALQEKHESTLHEASVQGLCLAYEYQRDTIKDPSGADFAACRSKMQPMMNILKGGSLRARRVFYERCCRQIENRLATMLTESREPPEQIGYCLFIIDNLAFFDYPSQGDLQLVLTQMQELYNRAGQDGQNRIIEEIFPGRMMEISHVSTPISTTRLQVLAAVVAVLCRLRAATDVLRRRGKLKLMEKAKGIDTSDFQREYFIIDRKTMIESCNRFVETEKLAAHLDENHTHQHSPPPKRTTDTCLEIPKKRRKKSKAKTKSNRL